MRDRITYCASHVFTSGVILYLLLVHVSIAFCASEKQTASRLRPKVTERSILLMGTDFLYKSNLNTDSVKGFNKMSKEKQDSALFASGRFIKKLDDTAVLNRYMHQIEAELIEYGFKVFLEKDIDSFFRRQGPSYIINLAQSELEEYVFPVTDDEVYDDTLMYKKRFILHGINFNNWFEISAVNNDAALKVVFSTHSARDLLKGGFQRHPLTLNVVYRYTVRNINMDDVLGLADFSGKKDAGYIFDYFFNEDLMKAMPENAKPKTYWHYDRLKNKIKPAGEWRFNPVENQ